MFSSTHPGWGGNLELTLSSVRLMTVRKDAPDQLRFTIDLSPQRGRRDIIK